MSRRVLVTHADEAIGRRLVARLHADDRIEHIVAAGAGPPPRRFDRIFSADDRLTYHRLDLTRHRSVRNFFGAPDVREPGIDAVIHLPRLGEGHTRELPLMAGVAERTAEARLVLQQTLEAPRVRTLVALSSAFVYRLGPGNANRLDEDADLDLDPTLPPVRAKSRHRRPNECRRIPSDRRSPPCAPGLSGRRSRTVRSRCW